MKGLEKLGATMDLYQANLSATKAETAALASVGKKSFLGLTAALAVWGYESTKWAREYQTQLTLLRTQAGLTVRAMNAIGAAAKANSASLGVNATTYVQAAYHPASNEHECQRDGRRHQRSDAARGHRPSEPRGHHQRPDGCHQVLQHASQWSRGHRALLNAIVGAGNMHYSDLNSALASGVANTSKTFGVSLSSLGSALAYMTDRGLPAAQAGTHLRMFETLLGAPTATSHEVPHRRGSGVLDHLVGVEAP